MSVLRIGIRPVIVGAILSLSVACGHAPVETTQPKGRSPLQVAVGTYEAGRWSVTKGPTIISGPLRPDLVFGYGGIPGDIPVTGDWKGTGRGAVGIYRKGLWILDQNNDHVMNDRDIMFGFGGLPQDVPVVGDWNGSGKACVGIYRGGLWVLDLNDNHVMDPKSGDAQFAFGGLPDDVPVVGQWNGGKKTMAGLYRRGGQWVLDTNGNGAIDSPGVDTYFTFGGQAGDVPVVGDWNGDGRTKAGIYRKGLWILDYDGSRSASGNVSFRFGGAPADVPVIGNW